MTTGSSSDRVDRDIGFVVVESQNLWANFVRAYLLSLVGGCRSRSTRVTLGNHVVTTPGALLLVAAQVAKGPYAAAPQSRRDEPAWHDKNVFLRTCQAIACSHIISVQAALSLQTRVFDDLPVFRNFYAHRNEESSDKAMRLASRQYLISRVHTPTQALTARAHRRPQPLLMDWMDDVVVVISLLCA
jgi:hypothetical protein